MLIWTMKMCIRDRSRPNCGLDPAGRLGLQAPGPQTWPAAGGKGFSVPGLAGVLGNGHPE